MSDEQFMQLCCQIKAESDPKKLTALLDELTKLLAEEQDAIKLKIAGRSIGNPL